MELQIKLPKNSSYKILLILCIVFINIQHAVSQQVHYPIKKVDGVACYVYTVQPSEGFYRIGKNFNTTEAEIRKFNPSLTNGLQVGMELFIPVNEPIPTHTDTRYIEHKVQKKQTIYSIRRQYNITEDELIQHNPEIKNRPLQIDEILKIPVKSLDIQKTETNSLHNQSLDTITTTDSEDNFDSESSSKHSFTRDLSRLFNLFRSRKPDTIHVAFLLPFMVEKESESSDSRFIEFYSGALVAIQQAKKEGINFIVHTFDVEKSDLRLMEVLMDSTVFETLDLIIGPVYSNQVSIIGDFARMQKIKTLIPFSSKIYDLDINPYIYQFNPGQETELDQLQEIMRYKGLRANIVFADLPHININDDGYLLARQLQTFLINQQISYQTVLFDQTYPDSLQLALNPHRENIVIFNTSRISNIKGYLPHLNAISDSITLKIYEPYSWRTSKIKRPQAFYLSIFKNDFTESSAYDQYMLDFNTLFEWTPVSEAPRYDLLGYDLMNCFIRSIFKENQTPSSSYNLYKGIQSDVKFERKSEQGGYINKIMHLYE